MANLSSAIKKIRTDARRKAVNDTYRDAYRSAIRNVKKAVDAKGADAAAALNNAYKSIDKAAKQNILHPNKAARLKSRLSALVSKPKN